MIQDIFSYSVHPIITQASSPIPPPKKVVACQPAVSDKAPDTKKAIIMKSIPTTRAPPAMKLGSVARAVLCF